MEDNKRKIEAKEFLNKVVVITGASSGIGKACALYYLNEIYQNRPVKKQIQQACDLKMELLIQLRKPLNYDLHNVTMKAMKY